MKVLSSQFLCSHLFVCPPISYKNLVLFLHFKTSFCCATSVIAVWWRALLPALLVSPKSHACEKEGKETQKHMELSTLSNLCAMQFLSNDDFQLPHSLQLGDIILWTSHLSGMLLADFLTVSQTLSNPCRCHSVIISVVLKLIHISNSVISQYKTTSDKSRCIYFTFLEEKKNKWIQLDYAIENATNQFPQ